MACILNIETATKVCSFSISVDGKVVFNCSETNNPSHASLVGIYSEKALRYARENQLKIDAVSVSAGPGSYTGLRIGISTAKGLCYGLNVPLLAVPTLKIIALSAINQSQEKDAYYCPMIDARRMEVYSAFYDFNLNEKREIQADIIDENSYKDYLVSRKIIFAGDGSGKCKDIIQNENAVFLENIHPLAETMAAISEKAYQENQFEDIAYYEPFYLKEFQATIPKNKVINVNQ